MITTRGAPGPPQVAFVAGRRVGTAVARNRAKRRLREATASVRLCDDMAYVVIAQRGVNDAPFDELVEWLGDAASRGAQAQPVAAVEDGT
jgi:ribonuclease P protein component